MTAADRDRTIDRLRDLGAVILSFQVTGATYMFAVNMPPGELVAEGGHTAMNYHRQECGAPPASAVLLCDATLSGSG